MELSGLNKALHSLYCKKLSANNQSETRREIVCNVNVILGKIKECDQDKTIIFKEVNGKLLQSLSSKCYEVYAILKSLEDMVEVVDAVEEGFSRLELTNRGPLYDWPWYGCLDVDGFLELPAVHQRLKKLGCEAIQELHSNHVFGNVQITEEDMNSTKFRFELSTKFHGNVIVYVIPAVEIEMRPRCLRSDIPLTFQHHKVLLTANGSWSARQDDHHRSLWQVSLLTVENELFEGMDVDGGIRWIVRELVHLLCEKYVHYPVTRKIVDTLLTWNLWAHLQREDWLRDKVALRVLELLENLRRALRNHRVRSYFIPSYNMLGKIDGLKLDKSAERLQYLIGKLQENPYCLQLFTS